MNGTGICIYTNREGEHWIVRECQSHPELRGVWYGIRHTDGQRVRVHEHRLRWLSAEEAANTHPQPTVP